MCLAQRTIKARKIGTNIRLYLNYKWLQKPSKDGGFRRVKFFGRMEGLKKKRMALVAYFWFLTNPA